MKREWAYALQYAAARRKKCRSGPETPKAAKFLPIRALGSTSSPTTSNQRADDPGSGRLWAEGRGEPAQATAMRSRPRAPRSADTDAAASRRRPVAPPPEGCAVCVPLTPAVVG